MCFLVTSVTLQKFLKLENHFDRAIFALNYLVIMCYMCKDDYEGKWVPAFLLLFC